ncbi:MAG: penicillin-binding transpeptidase domain-containing protein [Chloroflexota bacterium]
MSTFAPFRKIARRVLIVLSLILLSACGGVSLNSSEGGAPIIQIATAPADSVRAFLDAWNRLDYQTMYSQLSSQSQGLSTFSVFQAVYQEADRVIGTTGITYSIHNTHEQGTSAAVSYDAAIQSNIFGAVEDNGRVMRLVRAPDNTWKLAWSTMDIINGYAPGTRLSVQAQRPPRGNILDHNGQLMVEQDSDVTELYLARQEIPDEAQCIDLLAVILRRTRADLLDLIGTYAPETVVPIGDVDPDIFRAREAELINTCKIRTNTRTTRRYVGHGIATHLLGYIGAIPSEQLQTYLDNGYAESDYVGLAGVEAAYEEELAGKSERVLRVIEPSGMIVRELAGTSGEPSHDVTVTLDLNLQWAAAQALSDAYNTAAGNWGAPDHSPGGGVVVMDVHSGAVLALASYPTFDPGIFDLNNTPIFEVGNYIAALQSDPRSPFSNRATQEQYAPGSTFKIITLAATAEEGVFSPDETFNCVMEWHGQEFGDSQPLRYDWRQFEVDEQHFATGPVSMSQALTASCNPFFYQMGAALFRQGNTLEEYARRMGLGRATGFDLAPIVPEASGQLPVLTSTDQAISAAIGQLDTQVTILQMARMVSGIANGGTLYTPYAVQQVGGEDGSEALYVAEPTVAGNMGLSDSTLAIIHEGMCNVTRRSAVNQVNGFPLGTAWFVFDEPPPNGTGIAPYSVCGKTGTAQTARTEPFGWFVAFAPADDPQIAVAAMIEYGREGSETAAPIVRRILDAYFGASQAPYPYWWSNLPYIALNIPEGSTGG